MHPSNWPPVAESRVAESNRRFGQAPGGAPHDEAAQAARTETQP
jgi:hypothetical protein